MNRTGAERAPASIRRGAADAPMPVLFATCAQLPDGDPDDLLALPALRAAGLDPRLVVWDTPEAASTLPIVIRSTWDYSTRRGEFLAWASSLPTVFNPAPVLAWTTDKVYLGELAAAGVPVVPTAVVVPGEDPTDAVAAAGTAGTDIVVKPTVSAGSKDTRRHRGPGSAVQHARELLALGRALLVQPYQPAVDDAGETGLIMIDGELSHAFSKGPLLAPDADATPGLFAREQIAERTAEAAQRALARQVMTLLQRRFPAHAPLLYARVDVVPGADGEPVLLELELAEPSLWLVADPARGERFATALAGRVRTLQQ